MWGAGGGSIMGCKGGGGAFASFSGYIPFGYRLTVVVGAAGQGGGPLVASGGGFSGAFEGGTVSQASALVVAGAGGGAAGMNDGFSGGTFTGVGPTGEVYSGGPLQGGSSFMGSLAKRGGSPGGGDAYATSDDRKSGGGGGGYLGGAAGPNLGGADGPSGARDASGWGGSCYTKGGVILSGYWEKAGNYEHPDRGASGDPNTDGRVIVRVNGKNFLNLSTPQTQTISITGA